MPDRVVGDHPRHDAGPQGTDQPSKTPRLDDPAGTEHVHSRDRAAGYVSRFNNNRSTHRMLEKTRRLRNPATSR